MDVLTSLTVAILLLVLALGAFVVWSHFKMKAAITKLTKLVTGTSTEPVEPVDASEAFRTPAPEPKAPPPAPPPPKAPSGESMSAFSFGEEKPKPPTKALASFNDKCSKCSYILRMDARFCASCSEVKNVEHMHMHCGGCGHNRLTQPRAS